MKGEYSSGMLLTELLLANLASAATLREAAGDGGWSRRPVPYVHPA